VSRNIFEISEASRNIFEILRGRRALPINRPPVAAAHDPMIPTVAMRQFVAAIGAAIAHRTVARDYQVTGTIAGPGAGVSMHAPAGASFARVRQRQDPLDHRPVVVMDVMERRLEHE
jgi:hypothetical protein